MKARVGSTLEQGVVLGGRYRVDVELGRGGFGAVYRGHHLVLNIPIAIKVMFPREDAPRRALELLIEEAHLTARLSHPAIARILDANYETSLESGAIAYLVLEWIEGESLARARVEQPIARLSPEQAFRLLRPVISALAYAHAQGLVHRDVKPANIMLVGDGPLEDRQAKLVDFGVGKLIEPDLRTPSLDDKTRRGGGFTLAYAAPEQVLGSKTGPWTDIHAVGLVFTELLTGRQPFDGDDLEGVLTKTRPTPRAFGRNVGALEDILARTVAVDPRERPSTMRALLDELDHHFRHRAPPSRLRTVAFAVAALGALVLLTGIAGIFWFGTTPRDGLRATSSTNLASLPPAPSAPLADRPVPRYTLRALRERLAAAGFSVLSAQGDEVEGESPRLAITVTGPCEVSVSQAESVDEGTAAEIVARAGTKNYLARADGKRVFSVTFPARDRACAEDLFEKLMR